MGERVSFGRTRALLLRRPSWQCSVPPPIVSPSSLAPASRSHARDCTPDTPGCKPICAGPRSIRRPLRRIHRRPPPSARPSMICERCKDNVTLFLSEKHARSCERDGSITDRDRASRIRNGEIITNFELRIKGTNARPDLCFASRFFFLCKGFVSIIISSSSNVGSQFK